MCSVLSIGTVKWTCFDRRRSVPLQVEWKEALRVRVSVMMHRTSFDRTRCNAWQSALDCVHWYVSCQKTGVQVVFRSAQRLNNMSPSSLLWQAFRLSKLLRDNTAYFAVHCIESLIQLHCIFFTSTPFLFVPQPFPAFAEQRKMMWALLHKKITPLCCTPKLSKRPSFAESFVIRYKTQLLTLRGRIYNLLNMSLLVGQRPWQRPTFLTVPDTILHLQFCV